MSKFQFRITLSLLAILSWLLLIGVNGQHPWFNLLLLGMVIIIPVSFVLSVLVAYLLRLLNSNADLWQMIWVAFTVIPFVLSIFTYVENYKPTYRFEVAESYEGVVILLENDSSIDELKVSKQGVGYISREHNEGSKIEIYHGDESISEQFTGAGYLRDYSIWKSDSTIQEWFSYNCFEVTKDSKVRPCDTPDSIIRSKMSSGAIDSGLVNWKRYDYKKKVYLK